MENHGCKRGEVEERVGEDDVRNGGVWKTIYREDLRDVENLAVTSTCLA